VRAFALGLLAGASWLQCQATLPPFLFSVLLLPAALAALLLQSRLRSLRPLWIFAAALAIGVAWPALLAGSRLNEALPVALEGQDIVVVGTIDSLPDKVERGWRFHFAVESAHAPDGTRLPVPSRIALGLYDDETTPDVQVHPGERWQWTVRLRRPHGNANPYGFDYEAWLLSEGLRATGNVRPANRQRLNAFVWRPHTVLDAARSALRQRIFSALPNQPYAGVLVALVIGDQRAVSQSDWTIFTRTGIGHLVSISGLHITMIAALFAGLLHWSWRHSFFTRASLPLRLPAQKAAAAGGLVAALVYVALAGFGIPAQRTLIMLAVVTAALWLGRITAVSQVLSAALAAVLLMDPWAVLSPGFWLSFAAIACILMASAGRAAAPLPDTAGQRLQHSLRGAVRTQVAITLGLVPLTMLLFAQVSLVGPLANAVAIPLVSFLVTPLSLVGSIAPDPLCGWLLGMAHALMDLLAQWLGWLGNLPLAVWQAPQPDALSFALAAAGTLWLLAPRGWPWRWMGLLSWLPIMFNDAASPYRGFRLMALDIGQGNAVLIETATHRLLFDTGPAFSGEADSGSRVLLPYFRARGIGRLDGMVISHSDLDHSGGAMSVLKGLDVGWVSSSLPASHPIVPHAPNHHACVAGQSWSWDGVRFEMLQPTAESYAIATLKPNARSCTLKISYQGLSALLTGDIEAAQERALLERMPDKLAASVLLAPHHGSGTSSTLAFLQAVKPGIALFQVGYRNRYRHPKPEIFERYRSLGINRLRTDESGAISVELDEAITFSEYRSTHRRYWQSR
jgi:competence protein ComEC